MTAPPADDLKGYDVPDPRKPRGWVPRALLCSGAGLLVAGGLLRAVRLPHLVWVAEHHPGRDPEEVGYINGVVIDDLREQYDADALRPYALGIDDPKIRGAFHQALVGTGDAAQLEAMKAYLLGMQSWHFSSECDDVIESMAKLDVAKAAELLVPLSVTPPWSNADSFREHFDPALAAKVPPAALLPAVLKIEELDRRGRFHAALATTKDPAHIDAVLAYAGTVLPTNPGASRPKAFGPIVASLSAFGPAATPRLEAVLEQTDSRSLVSLAAEALCTSDLPFLVRRARALLDEYDAGVPALAAAQRLVSAVEDEGEQAPAERVAAARERLERASARAFMIFEVLRALAQVKGDQAVDFCIVRGLSTFNPAIAEWSAEQIELRFSPDQLVDTLFSYIAQKTEFQVAEVEVYEGLLRKRGESGARRVAENLGRLIAEAKGDPDEVFWLYKKMGFTLLGELGGPDAVAVLRKYARDPGRYVLTSTDGQGGRRREERRYADEVRAAIMAIEARAGGR